MAEALVARKFSEIGPDQDRMNRATEATELLAKLGMDDETLAAAMLFPFAAGGWPVGYRLRSCVDL